ncbi:MAG: hypothetical protein EA401_09545 [Planctomycetota bacterium]|nr:MAG: hypothetical protein EA401_09545 [Planctomycetota bacterium]
MSNRWRDGCPFASSALSAVVYHLDYREYNIFHLTLLLLESNRRGLPPIVFVVGHARQGLFDQFH